MKKANGIIMMDKIILDRLYRKIWIKFTNVIFAYEFNKYGRITKIKNSSSFL